MKKKEAKIKQVYEYIDSYTQDNGFPPSVREICTACNVKSTASVYDYINILVEQGLLSKGDSKKRAITSVKGKVNYRSVPVVGTVTAGQPILAYENIEGYYPLPDEFGQDVFMLSVIGSSMIDAGIYSGDKIIVKRQTTAENGDIVVAFFEDKATVIARIKEASKYVPLENLCLSPQCGFSSNAIGNKLTEEDQWKKLALVKEIAKEVWGEN